MKPIQEYAITESQVNQFMTPIIIAKKNIKQHVYIHKTKQNPRYQMLFKGKKLHRQTLHQATHTKGKSRT